MSDIADYTQPLLLGNAADEVHGTAEQEAEDSVFNSTATRTDLKPRVIFVNDPDANRRFRFRKNAVHTTKYSPLTFIPKNLFEQFCRAANVYFLIIALLQIFTNLSPTGRATTGVPLVLVLTICALKDGFEDWKRRLSDFRTNHRKVLVFQDGRFQKRLWKDLTVGSIVKIVNKESIPADVVILSTSEVGGLCYVETSSLDGETNLKIRRAQPGTMPFDSEHNLLDMDAVITCEQPNKNLHNYEGYMVIDKSTRISLDADQMLLRGCSLRNTEWVIAAVVFSGSESKLQKNQKSTPFKQSKVEKQTNRLIFLMFALLIFLCLACAICVMIFTPISGVRHWYLRGFYIKVDSFETFCTLVWEGFKSFLTFVILFNNLIPISLYVSIEVAKLLQGTYISQDLTMYHDESDTPARVNCSSLNEELGQVEFIFSDKTGTLTCNQMVFQKFSIAGESFGTGITEIARAVAKRVGRELIDDRPPGVEGFYDERISNLQWTKHEKHEDIREFFTLLSVCHTVIPEGDPSRPDEIQFQASSPDDAALVKAAQELGCKFHTKTPSEIIVEILGEDHKFEILNVCDFTSNRKRMSVICRTEDGRIVLYCKGADTVIASRLRQPQKYGDATVEQLEEFARDGLRTLVCAKAELDEAEYEEWSKVYEEASCAVFERERRMEEAAELIEKNLELVGATAIEDKLQEGVPDTISELANANIRIWVLTGDKQETAINIGFACDLLHNNMALIVLEGEKRSELYTSLRRNLEAATSEEEDSIGQSIGLVVDGEKLETILADSELKIFFLQLGVLCRAVICCRVSPSQKAEVVTLVRKHLGTITLAIGDGANDVSMIQAAHVGVGISGMEGLQAANSSDYAIGQFRFLKRLLLVHGRWSYRRISKLILYSFYKNTVLYLTQLWFVFFNGFSGTTLHDRWTVAFYNVIFTSLPVMGLAIFDYDIKADVACRFPELYTQGHRNKFFNLRTFLQWTMNSIFHSAICFFIPVLLMNGYGGYIDGTTADLLNLGITVYTSVLLVVTLKVMIETSSFTWINWAIIALSLFSWPAFILVYAALYYVVPVPTLDLLNLLPQALHEPILSVLNWLPLPISTEIGNEFYGILGQYRLFINPNFYLVVILTTIVAISRDFVWKAWKRLTLRKFYYDVQERADREDRDAIMLGYPLEEGIADIRLLQSKRIRKKRTRLELRNISHVLSTITGIDMKSYRGFAFSTEEKRP